MDSQADPSQEETETKKDENEGHVSPKMIIYSSGDEDSVDIKSRTVRKKKRKRVIEFSDDEDAQGPLTFDDEENEMPTTVFTGFKNSSKGGIRAEFLENEAELSGSEANSDDEAEESEDDFEEMEGDREHFDSNELRDQVGKAHLRSLLDSDKREVRLLQEMYLEDGELHGEGRSRQFRWKNLDKRIENDEIKTLSDEEGSDDNMEDSEWRKQKIEREKFLLEQKAKMADGEADLYDVGSWSSSMHSSKGDLGKRNSLTSFPSLKRKRGSFLNRDTTTLARIAEFTKDGRDIVGGAKQGGNFVFQQLGVDESKEKEEDEENVSVTQKRRNSLPPKVKKAKIDKFLWNIENSQSSSSVFEFL
ncbi:Claspin [Portunus trituberculatus]|uniref:Claspin n=2 Tax=Portunus trituberculatus TaxID=210409 RepID=A0A5B7CDU1_PORTR|nr:Claspin [Portunus trituberculatus]